MYNYIYTILEHTWPLPSVCMVSESFKTTLYEQIKYLGVIKHKTGMDHFQSKFKLEYCTKMDYRLIFLWPITKSYIKTGITDIRVVGTNIEYLCTFFTKSAKPDAPQHKRRLFTEGYMYMYM